MWRRALLAQSAVSVRNGVHELGIQHAADVLSAEPFDEMACQALMRAHAVAGNRAEVLRVPPTLTRWNVEDRTRLTQAALPEGRQLTFVNFSNDARTLALGGDDKAVVLWDVTEHKAAASPLADHPDGAAKVCSRINARGPDGRGSCAAQ